MFLISRLLIPILVICLCSCASRLPDIETNYSFDNSPDKGLLIGEISWRYDENLGDQRRPKSNTIYYCLVFKNTDTNAESFILLDDRNSETKETFPESPLLFSGTKGASKVFAIELNPGNYTIARWQVGMIDSTETIESKNKPEANFQIEEKEVTYIGNLHLKVIRSNKFNGLFFLSFSAVEDGRLIITNEKESNIEQIKIKYPSLDLSQVNIQVSKQSQEYTWKGYMEATPSTSQHTNN